MRRRLIYRRLRVADKLLLMIIIVKYENESPVIG